MIEVGRVDYMRSPDAEDIFESDFFSEDKKFQTVSIHALRGGGPPGSLDELANGLLYVMNRGVIFLCFSEPKKGKFDWNRAGYAAAHVAAGPIGVVTKGLIDVAFSAKNFEKKMQQAFEHPLSFWMPYTDIETVEVVKFGGIFGKLKDVVIGIRARDSLGNSDVFWIQAKNEDETWADLFCIMKFVDESNNLLKDYIGHKTGSFEYATKLWEEALSEGEPENPEIVEESIAQKIGEYMDKKRAEMGLNDDRLIEELVARLARYKGVVSDEIYDDVMNS